MFDFRTFRPYREFVINFVQNALPILLGSVPPWSKEAGIGYRIKDCATSTNSAALFATFVENGRQMVLLARRPEDKTNPESKRVYIASGGGYLNPGFYVPPTFIEWVKSGFKAKGKTVASEDQYTGALREFREEICRPNRSAVLNITDTARLALLGVGQDERRVDQYGHPTYWTSFHLALHEAEAEILKRHVQEFHTNKTYADECRKASNFETYDLVIMPLDEAAALSESEFMHPNEYHLLGVLNNKLKATVPVFS